MNVFIQCIYYIIHAEEVRFPLIYYWLKDYYYQQSPENFDRISNWSFSDSDIPIRNNPELQAQLKNNPPDVVGLSLYLWNVDILLDNARWIKENYPNCTIVAAGPNADSRDTFLKENTYIDCTVPGPAAETFRRILDNKLAGLSVQDVAGVAYWNGENAVRNKPVPRGQDPLIFDYVNNFRDEVIQDLDRLTKLHKKVIFMTMYIQGCPYSCSFCEQGTSAWTKINKREIQKLYDEVDLLAEYDNCVYEFADANFGIVPEYEDIVDYVIANGKGKIGFKKPPLAKNNPEFTSYLLKKLVNAGIYKSDSFGSISLQDPNPEIVKMNGRPFSKEYIKIKEFQEFTKNEKYKTGHVEIILGMPGQTYSTLTDSLNELLKNNLLSNTLPYFYLVFPNTVLTSPDSTSNYKFKDKPVWYRNENSFYRAMLDNPQNTKELSFNKIIETQDLSTPELAATWYHWTLMCHIYGFLRWLETPLVYLQNYHGISSHEFIKKYTKFFHPDNWHRLPVDYHDDLQALFRWFSGEDKFFMRYEPTGNYPINPRMVSQFRFHRNPELIIYTLRTIFSELCDVNSDENFDDLMNWQKSQILSFDEHDKSRSNNLISYNFDDIARGNAESYWKSDWKFTWPREDIYKRSLLQENIQFVPQISFAEIDPHDQKELKKDHLNKLFNIQ